MSKHFAGIDIGSCSIELVLVDDSGIIVLSLQTDNNFDPMKEARKLLNGVSYDRIMATTLGYDIEEFGKESLLSKKDLNISSMCNVFAESEVTSLIAKGQSRRDIARALHVSVIRRAAGMINRVSSEGDIVFTGGVAKNPCMRHLLSEKLGRNVIAPENPQMTGALGAALLAVG